MKMMKFDFLILGSGLGGLQTAYILSKEGFNVCVIEKNSQLGGAVQNFKRDGIILDAGVHYIGAYDEGQILHRYFKFFSLTDKIRVKRLDEDGFDRISFGDNNQDYKFAIGYDNFIKTLLKRFPKEKESLETYIKDLQKLTADFELTQVEAPFNFNLKSKYYRTNIRSYLESITKNSRLQNVLAGSNLLYAGEPNKTPLFIHSLIMNSYIQSAYRFINGSSQITAVLANSIIANGGTIKKQSEAKELLFEEDKICCVLLRNGEKLYASTFISDIHPALTLKMIPEEKVRRVYFNRIIGLNNTASVFTLYLILKKNIHKYLNYNVYYSRDKNVWTLLNYDSKVWPQSFLMMTQVPSQDREFADGITIMTYMKYDEVKKWENSTVGERPDTYEAFKKQKTDQLLTLVEQRFPGLKEKIKSIYASTPLTYRDYLGTPNGSLYGILHNYNDPLRTHILPRTKISNLFLTGQNINVHGVLGVTIGAVLTCSEFLGMDYLISKIKQAQ